MKKNKEKNALTIFQMLLFLFIFIFQEPFRNIKTKSRLHGKEEKVSLSSLRFVNINAEFSARPALTQLKSVLFTGFSLFLFLLTICLF